MIKWYFSKLLKHYFLSFQLHLQQLLILKLIRFAKNCKQDISIIMLIALQNLKE